MFCPYHFWAWIHSVLFLLAIDPQPDKKEEDDTHEKIMKLIKQESVNVEEMVNNMKNLEAQISVDKQSVSSKSSESSQTGMLMYKLFLYEDIYTLAIGHLAISI